MFRILLFIERLSITFPVCAERNKDEIINAVAVRYVLFILQEFRFIAFINPKDIIIPGNLILA